MKRLLVSHVDLDGVGSVVLAKLYNEKLGFDSFMCRDYGFEEDDDDFNFICSFDEVIMADISVPKEYAERVRSKGISLRLFDHHIGAEWVKDDKESVYDDKRSGTRLFWEEYARPIVKRYHPSCDTFVCLIDTYDRWERGSELWADAKGLNNVMYSMFKWNGPTDNFLDRVAMFISSMEKKIINMGSSEWVWSGTELHAIETAEAKEKAVHDLALESMQDRTDSKGRKFALIKASSKISLVCSSILDEYPDLDYLVCMNTWGGVNGKISVRTADKFDLNELAGIKGHAAAAGGKLTPEKSIWFWQNDVSFAYKDDPDYKDDDENTWFVKV